MKTMSFDEVIGQSDTRERLMRLCAENRLPHAMMLCGPRGCGKMAVAIVFARYLLSVNPETAAQDGANPAMIKSPSSLFNNPDMHFSYPTIKLPSMGSDHKPVSDDFAREWREMLADGPYFSMDRWMTAMGAENQQAIITAGESDELTRKLSLKSSRGGYKVSLIWLPERMNIECANKMLKLIEEPPSHTVFIMVCDEPDKLLETIRSRTQRIDMKRIDDESVMQALTERRGLSADDAARVARMANGDWLKALEQLSADSENGLFLDMFRTLMRLAYMRNARELKKWSDTMQTFGREKQKRFLDYFLRMARENFMYNFRNPELVYMTKDEEEFAKNFARFVNEANIFPICDLANRAIRDISQNANGKIVFFDMALQMIVLLIQKS